MKSLRPVMRLKTLLLLSIVLIVGSCVSQKKYNDMYALWVYADSQYQLIKQTQTINTKNWRILAIELDSARKEILRLRADSAFLDSSFSAYKVLCEQDRDKLKMNLTKLSSELENKASSLKLSAQKIAELEAMLYRKDSIMRVTRDRLTAALLGFKDKGVNVHVVGGKVYISLDERLLFQSGKVDVNPAGKTALLEIAKALNIDTTTNLTIEGHTDDLPYKSSFMLYKDNWDISVLRATSVVRLLQHQGAVSPHRFIASGRAEFYPIDPAKTPEARKKNRRIEIIVTPDLDEIARLLSN
jgi:chemotaxis protein MotB